MIDTAKKSYDTPLQANAFDLEDHQKIKLITKHFHEIMNIMGLDLKNESLKNTPKRVAKMYINEICSGLNPKNKPKITLFPNHYGYDRLLVQKNIQFYSVCEHHFVPIEGRVHVAYIPQKFVIGLSKLNRVVQFFARRPQVQERLTIQIGEEFKSILETEHVGIFLEARHFCVCMRGIKDDFSSTTTSFFSGRFSELETKEEFLRTVLAKS